MTEISVMAAQRVKYSEQICKYNSHWARVYSFSLWKRAGQQLYVNAGMSKTFV